MEQDTQKTIMASAFCQAVVALSIGTCFYRPQIEVEVVFEVACFTFAWQSTSGVVVQFMRP